MAHLNVRSLLPKIDYLRHEFLNKPVELLCISESWLHSSITDNLLRIPGYNLVRQDRNITGTNGVIKTGGGVCIFLREELVFTPLGSNRICTTDIELMVINIIPENCRKLFSTFIDHRMGI